MDNEFAAPSLILPAVPSDFEKKCGVSKTDFVNAVFELLASCKIAGINQDQPTPYDLAALSAQVEANTAALKVLNRPIRRLITAGINNGVLVVNFPDIGTDTDYSVEAIWHAPAGSTLPKVGVLVGSKKSTQVQLVIDGAGSTFSVELVFTNLVGI